MGIKRSKTDYYRPFYDEWGRLNLRLPIPTTSRLRYEEELDFVEDCLEQTPGEGEVMEVMNLSCFRPGRVASWGYRFMRIPLAMSAGRYLALVEVYLDDAGNVLGYSAPVTQVAAADAEQLRDLLNLIRDALYSGKILKRNRLDGFFEVEPILN